MKQFSISGTAARSLILAAALMGQPLAASAATLTFNGSWVPKADLIRPRGEHATVVVNKKIYVLGGLHDHMSGPAAVDRYNPSTNVWSQVTTLPLNRNHFNAAVYGSEIWVVGGKTGDPRTGTKRVDIYNVATNTWRSGPSLPEVHWGGPSVVVGDELHVLTGTQGKDASFVRDHHFVLDLKNPSASWQNRAAVPRPRVHAGAVAINGKIYLIGGELSHAHTGDTTDVQIYNPATDSWNFGRRLPMPRSHTDWNTIAFQGSILSISGVDSSKTPRAQAQIYQYFPDTNSWSRLEDLPRRLASPGAAIVNNVLYVSGGGVNDWFDADPITGKAMTTLWARGITATATAATNSIPSAAPIPLPTAMPLLATGIAAFASLAGIRRGRRLLAAAAVR